MKKIITFIMVSILFTTFSSAAEKDTTNYIKLLNENIALINAQQEEKATIGSMIKFGINDGYILPSRNNERNLKEGLTELTNNITGYNIPNEDIKILNDLLLDDINDLIVLLDERIECKNKTLDSNNRLMKFKYVLIDDSEKVNIINKKIESINKTYQSINQYNKKINSKKFV